MLLKSLSTVVAMAVAVPLALAAPATAAPPTPPDPLRSGLSASGASIAHARTAAAAELPTAAPPSSGTLRADLDALVSAGATAALAEVRGPAGVRRAASGVSRLGHPGPAPVNGRFRTGSVTKTFVATVVLQLAAERRLRLDDPVERWLPGLVPTGDRITLRHLLTHTSGLYNYTNDVIPSLREWLDHRYRTWRPAELVLLATRHPVLFAPGADWSYSNTNYVLLGMVIGAVTGRGYAAEIRHRILRPLGLRHTESPGARLDIAGPHAHGYLPREEVGAAHPVDVTRMNPTIAGAAGDMITTTADLNAFFRALLTGRLLPAAQLTEMKTAVSDAGYGMGLETMTLPCGVTVFGHGGGIFGYATLSLHTADARRQLTVSVNPYSGDLEQPAAALLNRAFCPSR